jgi:hypothetical protein
MAVIMFVFVGFCITAFVSLGRACQFENTPPLALNKKSVTYVPICFIINDRSLIYTEVKFDVLTRVIFQNSFAQVTAPNACASNTFWFPQGCTWSQAGLYAGPGLGSGAPTNYYAKVLGLPSIYKKRYAGLSSTGVSSVFPIVTLVIEVDGGKVKKVYWDDDCYFNEGGSVAPTALINMNCRLNAYDLMSNNVTSTRFLNPTGPLTSPIGFDTALSVSSCKTNPGAQPLPAGFCDLGIYVVWTGTSADGQQLASAGQRFKRFRDYAMSNQYYTVSSWQQLQFLQLTLLPSDAQLHRPCASNADASLIPKFTMSALKLPACGRSKEFHNDKCRRRIRLCAHRKWPY